MFASRLFYCFRHPKNQSIIESDEILLNGAAPYHFLMERFELWCKEILPSMEEHAVKTIDVFCATDLTRPEQAVATVQKGPIKATRRTMGSSSPGYTETLPYQYYIKDWQPTSVATFPFPKDPSELLKKTKFCDEPTITAAVKETISLLKEALAANFNTPTLDALISQTQKLIEDCGGLNLCPHPHPLPTPSVESIAIDVLDVVFLAIKENHLTSQVPPEALNQHETRLTDGQEKERSLTSILNSIKLGNL